MVSKMAQVFCMAEDVFAAGLGVLSFFFSMTISLLKDDKRR